MSSSKLSWVILALLSIVVIVIVSFVATLIALDYFRQPDNPQLISPLASEITPSATGSAGTGRIDGMVWHDLCAIAMEGQPAPSGSPQGCIPLAGGGYLANGNRDADEPGIADVNLRLGQGECPAAGLAEATTAADGRFVFAGLAAGTYCVSVDPLLGLNAGVLLPGGWSVPLGGSTAGRSVSLVEGEHIAAVEFGWDYQFQPLLPTVTPTVTNTPTPTLTPTITPTPVPPIPCDWVGFVKDVTVPDGTILEPDEDFRKTWRLKNIGTCTWTNNYALVFVSGNRMTGDNVTPFKVSVQPGQTIDVSIDLTAPLQVGKHTGYWALRNASGVIFGLGLQSKDPFSVVVHVEKPRPTKLIYDLAENYCTATWVSATGLIDCPSDSYDVAGFIQRLDAPVMEGGRIENEQGLWVIPEGVGGGYLSGTFPPFKVEAGDRFRTVISCLDGYPACDVQFRLEYQVGGGEINTLGKWSEGYNGEFTRVDIDLTPLAGKNVRFILTIRALDTFDQDSGLWLRPSVWR